MATIYETERLIIKPTNIDDAEFIMALVNTPGWLENVGDRNVHSIADAEKYVTEKMLPNMEKYGYGNYTLILKTDGSKIGTCGIYSREGLSHCDIGYSLLPQYEKNGYINEAAKKMVNLAFTDFNLTTLQAITINSNQASKNVVLKLGFTFKENIFIPNDPVELCLFELKKGGKSTKK
jgi:[ribosomal protein S5]-alanine N-acetyltransferase